ncbi:hypothetical protein OGATHE_005413 [Ogataea polymorpha]|uniref:Uncharacterized protein n=1 Tax=Ogataea polymorpha TaxID=460523 RepID=A0A9P8NWK3_9ASCO|nr:hypothetical protein OGATHE_005413 [Ogataea polymorpha]
MSPKSPKTEPKISMTRIFTNKLESAASEIAAVDPVTPTATPQMRLLRPTVSPAQNNEYPVYKFSLVKSEAVSTAVSLDENTMAMIKPRTRDEDAPGRSNNREANT